MQKKPPHECDCFVCECKTEKNCSKVCNCECCK